MVLEKILGSPLDSKEIQPVHPKGNQSLIFIGRTDAEAETPILWPPDMKINSLEKTLMLGKIKGAYMKRQERACFLSFFLPCEEYSKKAINYEPRGGLSPGSSHVDSLISNFQPPELKTECLLFKPFTLWYSAIAAQTKDNK